VTARLVPTGDAEAPAVAVKGSPAAQLLVRRGTETRVWDGSSRLRAGDALALRVACEEYRHVAVAVEMQAEPERWVKVFESKCPAAGEALPFTLVADAATERERVAVAFSPAALGRSALERAIERGRRDREVWVTRFELDKEVVP
jgi:hypothetical protein